MTCFVRDISGATAIEYALVAGLISIVVVVGATAIGGSLTGFFLSLVPFL